MAGQISPSDVAEHLRQGRSAYLLDVRQPWENALARLPGSILIPLNELAQRSGDLNTPPDALIVVYCHHGIRSLSAAAYLERIGFSNVYSLAGGIDAWSCEVDPSVPRY